MEAGNRTQTEALDSFPRLATPQFQAVVLRARTVADRHLDAVNGAAGAGISFDRLSQCFGNCQFYDRVAVGSVGFVGWLPL